MINALLIFCLGALVLVVVVYVFSLVIKALTLPPEVKQIALVIVSLIGLIGLIALAISAYQGGIRLL